MKFTAARGARGHENLTIGAALPPLPLTVDRTFHAESKRWTAAGGGAAWLTQLSSKDLNSRVDLIS